MKNMNFNSPNKNSIIRTFAGTELLKLNSMTAEDRRENNINKLKEDLIKNQRLIYQN